MSDATTSASIGVVLALAPLLADLVELVLASDPSLRVVGRVDGDSDPDLAAIAALPAQVVVMAAEAFSPAIRDALFDARPRLKIVAVHDDGREGSACELAPRVTALGELSAERLPAAIRAVAARTWADA